METWQAWKALFSKQVPAGADFKAAATALNGLDEIAPDDANKLEDEEIDNAEEFLTNPAAFIEANKADERVPQWTTLATALGVTIGSNSGPAAAAPSAPPSAPAASNTLSTADLNLANLGGGGPSLDALLAPGGGDDKADARKRLADEVARQARKNAEVIEEKAQAKANKPKPVFERTRAIPQQTRRVLVIPVYQRMRDDIVARYGTIRSGSPAQKRAAKRWLGGLSAKLKSVESSSGWMVAGWLRELNKALIDQRDLTEPDWFRANHITGTYPDDST
jgi:hypothetical protein